MNAMNERGHLSAETIDLLMLSSLAPEQTSQARAHLDACVSCRERWSELEEDRQRFLQVVYPRTLPGVEARARPPGLGAWLRQRWALALPAVGLAAAAVLLVVLAPPAVDEGYVGVKGPLGRFEVVASRGPDQFAVKSGTVLRPGDRIRFVVEPGDARYVLIASKDGAGQVTIYYPYAGAASAAVGEGRQELPGSIELDEALGRERVVAVFSDVPIRSDEVRRALEASAPVSVPGASVRTLELVKEAK